MVSRCPDANRKESAGRMDLLKQAQKLYDELRKLDESYQRVVSALENKDKSYEELASLYAKEFDIVIKISGCYDDLKKVTTKLKRIKEHEFIAKRMEQNADKILRSGVIDVIDTI